MAHTKAQATARHLMEVLDRAPATTLREKHDDLAALEFLEGIADGQLVIVDASQVNEQERKDG